MPLPPWQRINTGALLPPAKRPYRFMNASKSVSGISVYWRGLVDVWSIFAVIGTVMLATESLAATKKLAITTEVAKELPYGLGDEQRLTQVLLNLVGNAINFTDKGEVRIAAGSANGHFTLSLSDTGPGVPVDERERIFEKFRQVDSSNTRAKGGTGLGLAIAREIVEMHGGRIWVGSTMGQGSTFRMKLPVRADAAAGVA